MKTLVFKEFSRIFLLLSSRAIVLEVFISSITLGLFGMSVSTFLLIPMYFIHVPATFSKNPYHRLEDVFDAIQEVKDNPNIAMALGLTIVRYLAQSVMKFCSLIVIVISV